MGLVAHLTTVHPRSDIRVLVKEARTLASESPHEVLLMVADGEGHEEADDGEVAVHDLGRLDEGRGLRFLKGSWRAFLALREIRPDLVHFHDPELIPMASVSSLLGQQVIYDAHEDLPSQVLSKHYLSLGIRTLVAYVAGVVERMGARTFGGVVAATPKIAERFPSSRSVVVRNYPIRDELLLSDPVPYRDRPPSFVYPGVIGETRGLIEVLRAVELLDEIPDLRMDLAGSFSSRAFGDRLRALPGWKAVEYHGVVPRGKVAELLGNARAGLVVHRAVPNEVHALPIKMFEFMAAGIPFVASRFGPLKEVVDEAGCGLVVDQTDPGAIADAMRWILAHPSEAMEMGRRGRRAIERRYNWEAEAEKLLALYDRLLVNQ